MLTQDTYGRCISLLSTCMHGDIKYFLLGSKLVNVVTLPVNRVRSAQDNLSGGYT